MTGRRRMPRSDAARASLLSEEERDEAEDERVEHDRLGEREAEPLDRGDLVAHLRLAGDRLDHLAEDEADADARTDRAQAGADAERDGLEALLGHILAGRLGERCERVDVHGRILLRFSGTRRPT